jgi:hypothetical protein
MTTTGRIVTIQELEHDHHEPEKARQQQNAVRVWIVQINDSLDAFVHITKHGARSRIEELKRRMPEGQKLRILTGIVA